MKKQTSRAALTLKKLNAKAIVWSLAALACAGTLGSAPAFAQENAAPAFVAPEPREVRRYLVVPIKFEDTISRPLKPSDYYLNLFTDPRFGAEIFYRVASNYVVALAGPPKPTPEEAAAAAAPAVPGAELAAPPVALRTGTAVAETVILPKAASAYQAPGEGGTSAWNHQMLVDEMMPILEQNIDLSQYYGLALFPNVADGTGLPSTARTVAKKSGASSTQPLATLCLNPANVSLSSLVREIGHHFDISDTRLSNPALKLGDGAMAYVGPADSKLGTITADHIMWHKQFAGWSTGREIQTLAAPHAKVVRLFPRSGPAQGLRMAKIALQSGDVLTLEAVLPAGIDGFAGLPGYGLQLHRINEAKLRRTPLGKFPTEALPEAIVSPKGSLFFTRGETYTSPGDEVTLKVERLTPEFVDVRVTIK